MNDLVTAAQAKDVGRLREILEVRKPAQSSSQNPSEKQTPRTLLEEACRVAARINDRAALEVLLDENGRIEGGFLNKGSRIEGRIISAAAFSGSIDVFGLFLDRGWDVNQELGTLEMHSSCGANKLELVKFLIANGADPNANLRSGTHTPLECAILSSTLILKALVNAGAQIKGRSALQMAACHGKTENISYLLECGAPIDEVPDNIYQSALCEEASRGNVEVVKLLLEKGASLDVKDKNGKSALELAEVNKHDVCADILREASALPAIVRQQVAIGAHE